MSMLTTSMPTRPKLVQLVRDATRQFIDVNNATWAGYAPAFGCVSGPNHGAMGMHYINGALVGDGEIDASRPEERDLAALYGPAYTRYCEKVPMLV